MVKIPLFICLKVVVLLLFRADEFMLPMSMVFSYGEIVIILLILKIPLLWSEISLLMA